MDEKYFYEHLHELIFYLEKNSVIEVHEKVNAMIEAEERMKELFPDAEVKLSGEYRRWTRDEEIWIDAKEINIAEAKTFLNAVRKADYVEFSTLGSAGIRLSVGFKKVMITKEEFENEEF